MAHKERPYRFGQRPSSLFFAVYRKDDIDNRAPALNPLEEAETMKLFIAAAVLTFALVSVATQSPDAPTGFDNKTNGMVDDATHQADQGKFDEIEPLTHGPGP